MHSKFFSRMEEKLRGWLSRNPILYALYAGIGVVLFWRGVWHGTDVLVAWYLGTVGTAPTSIDTLPSLFDSLLSFTIGSLLLISCGLFVSELVGKELIISGLRGEKKLTEKTEAELRAEAGALAQVLEQLDTIHSQLEELDVRRGKHSAPAVPPAAAPVPKPPAKTAEKK